MTMYDCPACGARWVSHHGGSAGFPECPTCNEIVCSKCSRVSCFQCHDVMHLQCSRMYGEDRWCNSCLTAELIEEFKDASLVAQLQASLEAVRIGVLGPQRKVG